MKTIILILGVDQRDDEDGLVRGLVPAGEAPPRIDRLELSRRHVLLHALAVLGLSSVKVHCIILCYMVLCYTMMYDIIT